MRNESIHLDGKIYNRENIDKLLVNDDPINSWRNAIYQFLQNWFDDSDFILAQTSGSTGKPKSIKLLKQSMINSASMTNHFFGLDKDRTALLCLPATYIAGKMMLVRALVGGFNLIAVEPSANPFLKMNTPIDFTAITPYQLFHSAESLRAKSVRKIIVGGGSVTSKLEKLAENIPAVLFETYGMTETCSHIALRQFNGVGMSDCFTILDGVTIRTDNRGCLAIKAPHLLEEVIQTNDMVELIGTTSFRWLGRADSAINSGGVKIHPELVEKKLEEIIPSSFFISAISDDKLGSKVVLVVESNRYTVEQLDNLKEKLVIELNKFEIPKEIYFLPDFVYSQSNKVLRKETLEKALEKSDCL
jgi:o-succinylbenzoate---CoA ligase